MSIARAFITRRQTSARKWVTTFCNGYNDIETVETSFRPPIVAIDEYFDMRKCPTYKTSLPGTSDVCRKGISYEGGDLRYAAKTFLNLRIETIPLSVASPPVRYDSPASLAVSSPLKTRAIVDDVVQMYREQQHAALDNRMLTLRARLEKLTEKRVAEKEMALRREDDELRAQAAAFMAQAEEVNKRREEQNAKYLEEFLDMHDTC